MCVSYLDLSGCAFPTACAKTKERSKAKYQWKSRDLEAGILTSRREKKSSRQCWVIQVLVEISALPRLKARSGLGICLLEGFWLTVEKK